MIRGQIRLPGVLRPAIFWLRLSRGPTRPAFVAVLDRMLAADKEYKAAAQTLDEALRQMPPAGTDTNVIATAGGIFRDRIDALVRASERLRDATLAYAAIVLALARDRETITAWDGLKAAADALIATDRRLKEFTLDGREAAVRAWVVTPRIRPGASPSSSETEAPLPAARAR